MTLDRPRGPLPTRVSDLPALPPEFDATVDAGIAALGISLDPDARAAIDAHARFLLAWTEAINLTAIREPVEVARLHVLDSLAAVPLLRERGVTSLLDIGSGGGFPGLPLAAACGTERTLLVDSVGKKVRFLGTVIEATGLERRVAAEAVRSEVIARDPRDRGRWQVVTARAVTSLAELVELALPLVAPGGFLLAWKREPLAAELEGAANALRELQAGPVDVLASGIPGLDSHRLVVIPRGGPVDARFPRDPAERKHRPL